ncbi:MAG: SDR family oxidoreductase [Aggregatilineales bacterium]
MSTNNSNELHIIFGTGPVGLAVMEELLAKGKRVRMINRSGRNANIPASVDVVSGDAKNLDFARKAAEGATHIYNALNPSYDKWLDLFPGLQAGTVAAAEATGAKLIVMENLYMYGHTHGKPMTENTPFNPHTRKGKLRAEMHETLMAAHNAGKIRVVMGRASDFVGSRALDTALGDRVIYPALEGKAASIVGKADLLHTYSYIPDVGTALVTLGEHDSALGQAWHIPNAPTITTKAYIEKIFAEAGHPAKISAAPKPILWLLGRFNPIIKEVYEMVYEFEEPFIVDHSKYVKAFGDHSTQVDTVVKETVKWYRENPKSANGH